MLPTTLGVIAVLVAELVMEIVLIPVPIATATS